MEDDFPLIKCDSTKGSFVLRVRPDWAPRGAPHLIDLVRDGVFERTVVYRVVPKEAASFGIPESEELRKKYSALPPIPDDPQTKDLNPHVPRDPNFHRGYLSFAGSGKDSRKVDVFITYQTQNWNGKASAPWEVPVAECIDGMDNVETFSTAYGDLDIFGGKAPNAGRIWNEGYGFLEKEYPLIDYVGPCKVVEKPLRTIPTKLVAQVLALAALGLLFTRAFRRWRRRREAGKS